VDADVLSTAELDAIDDQVKETVEDAVAFAEAGDSPDPARALECVYADQGYPAFPARRYR